MKTFKSFVCLTLALAVIIATFGTNVSIPAKAQTLSEQPAVKAADPISFWSGNAAESYADGDGTKENPYIIETADQLYKMVTSTSKLADGSPAYYKVSDYIDAFYLNDADTLEEIKALVKANNYKNWEATQTFHGVFDGNGVNIYGMVSYNANGFIYGLDESFATVKNVNFDSCYVYSSGNAAIVTTRTGSYRDEVLDTPTIAGISVRNSHIETTRKITLNTANGSHSTSAGGIVSTGDTAKVLTITNCFFDGYSSELVQGKDSTADATAGIFASTNTANNVTITGCVSLNAQVLPQVPGASYTRYDINNNAGFQVLVYSSYSTLAESAKETPVKLIEGKPEYEVKDMPELDWRNSWQLISVNDRTIPMPKNNANPEQNSNAFAQQIAKQNNGSGAYNVFGGANPQGTYGMYHTLDGSGTEQDPYLIYNAFQLARAIASGGKNVYSKLYYKLVCDIDASEANWITQDMLGKETSPTYKYVEFNGVLDGDGYTVTGLYSGDDQSVGLIPVLGKEGIVKNLHVRDSFFVSSEGFAGAIAGETREGSAIIGCSAEGSVAEGNATAHIAGQDNGAIKDSYYITDATVYYNDQGEKSQVDISKSSDLWYMGGREGSMPRLKSFAVTQDYVDVDGDGIAEEYAARDLTALRNHLLGKPEYEYIYGDVNRDGKTDLADLADLQRKIVGSYDEFANDFWYNLSLGKVKIYYGENDNYDAARRLEIFLESQIDADVQKVVSADKTVSGTNSDKEAVYVHANDTIGTPTGAFEIIVGNIGNYAAYAENTHNVNDYSIIYDEENSVLWLNGGSFTGVEQAVLDFVYNSNEKTGAVYTVENATLAPEKWAKTVMVDTNYDGVADTEKVLYYAWGDEFNSENGEISVDTWNHARMRTETEVGKAGNYNNVETVNEKELRKLYSVENGKLTITRGVKADSANAETDALGYVRLYDQVDKTSFGDIIDDDDIIANPGLIKANHSMLYKQGYAEMYGSLPSDGHTFASWWMLGHGNMTNFAMDESLYGKVYKLNNVGEYAYDGTSAWPISTDPTTYKYQVPTNHFEIDVWELMQNNSIAATHFQQNKLTGFYDYRLYLNVHKFYAVGARSQPTVNVINWDNPGTPLAVMQKEWFGNAADDYYFSTSAAYHDFTDGRTTRVTYSNYGFLNLQRGISANYVESLQKQLTAPRRYGFYWSTNGVDKFNFTLYIYDVNGDGIEDDNAILGTSEMTYNTQDGKKPSDYDVVNDAVVANQYMYFLFDNILYSSNPKHSTATTDNAAMFTDMLVNNGTADAPDKIDLEIDYLRVYQFDGRRDIITDMTESFNNGNHFGY